MLLVPISGYESVYNDDAGLYGKKGAVEQLRYLKLQCRAVESSRKMELQQWAVVIWVRLVVSGAVSCLLCLKCVVANLVEEMQFSFVICFVSLLMFYCVWYDDV